jgi:hypothetical protein
MDFDCSNYCSLEAKQEKLGECMASKSVIINGIRFRHGEVDWEDAQTRYKEQLPNFDAMRQGKEFLAAKVTSIGRIAKIGHYLLVITEMEEGEDEFDYTLIPLKAKISVRYTDAPK